MAIHVNTADGILPFPDRKFLTMSTCATIRRAPDVQHIESSWTCSRAEVDALMASVNRFLDQPTSARAVNDLLVAITRIAATGPGGKRALESVRRQRLKQDGGFGCRYVALKWLGANGQLTPLKQPVPARDGVRSEMAGIVAEQRERFPEGVDAFFEGECPLMQAPTAEFANIVARQVRRELKLLTSDVPTVTHKRLANLLDLSSSFRHLAQLRSAAHPKALEKIDAADASSMCDFLVAVAGRLPLTSAEFDRFLELARSGWVSDAGDDAILRGRVVTIGLDGQSALLLSWITPFVRELAVRGLLSHVCSQYRAARRQQRKMQPPEPDAEGETRVVEEETLELSLNDTAIHFLDGAAQPERMHVLRNYLRCSTNATIVSLDEALRIAEAMPNVPGHRQHVIRLFQTEGWIMAPRRRGEAVFEKREAVKQVAAVR